MAVQGENRWLLAIAALYRIANPRVDRQKDFARFGDVALLNVRGRSADIARTLRIDTQGWSNGG